MSGSDTSRAASDNPGPDPLRPGHRFYSLAIEQVKDYAIFLIGPDGKAATWNRGVERVLGWCESEWIGQPLAVIFPPEDVPEFPALELDKARAEGVASNDRWQVRKDGHRFWAGGITTALHDESGTFIGYLKVMRDMTDHHRANEEIVRLNADLQARVDEVTALINVIPVGIGIAYDTTCQTIRLNPAFADMLGLALDANASKTAAQGERPTSFRCFDQQGREVPSDQLPMQVAAREGREVRELELDVVRDDGRVVRLLEYASPLFDGQGQPRGSVGAFVDITERRRNEEALRDAQSRLQAALRASEVATWVWDIPRDRVYADANLAALFSMSPDNANGGSAFTYLDMLHPADRDRVASLVENAVRGETTRFEAEYRVRPTGRDERWVISRGVIERDAKGEPLRMPGIMVDITERKRAEEAAREREERHKLAVAIAELGTFEIDLRDESVVLNDTGRDIFGWSRDEPVSFDEIKNRIHPDDRVGTLEELRKAFQPDSAGEFDLENRAVRASDGAVRWIRSRGRVLFDVIEGQRRAIRCVGTYLDTTQRREADQQREHLLEAERAARVEAERVNRMKDEFLATLSHELRTPLNAIFGWSQLLRQNTTDPELVQQGLETIERNARAQTQLIEDLLDMSRIVSGKVRLDVQPVDLPEVIDAAVGAIMPAADAKQLQVQKIVDPRAGLVRGDPARLQQVLWNLLSNAVKFTPRGGRVQIHLKRVNSHIELSVTDTGMGIAPSFLPFLFERFRQADGTTTRQFGGLGLGLSIVKNLVELHGGSIRATSPGENHGATFIVALPVAAVQPEPTEHAARAHPAIQAGAAPADLAPPSLAGIRIVMVDDDADARELVRQILTGGEAEVLLAASVDEALVLLERERPDILISDIGMPGRDGYELIAAVRDLADAELSRTPAVALTAFARSEDRTRALRAGYQSHVAKPVDSTELLAVVERLAHDRERDVSMKSETR